MARQSSFLPYAISVVCCLFAYGVVACYKYLNPDSVSDIQGDRPDASAREPLIPHIGSSGGGGGRQNMLMAPLVPLYRWLDEYTGGVFSSAGKNPSYVVVIFFLLAIAKATRPLFTSYIQHRHGATSKQAQTLWLVRNVMSIVIFGIILPLLILKLPRKDSRLPNMTLYAGRISTILMGSGALLIGLSGSLSAITTALVINTLGVATDLSILAFSTTFVFENVAGRIFMLVSSCESAGTLLGIGVLYPIYQWSLQNDISFSAGGVPYYICAAVYAVAASLIWTLNPAPLTAH